MSKDKFELVDYTDGERPEYILKNGKSLNIYGAKKDLEKMQQRIEELRNAVIEAHRIILHEMDNGRTPTMLKAEHGGKGLGYFEDLITP